MAYISIEPSPGPPCFLIVTQGVAAAPYINPYLRSLFARNVTPIMEALRCCNLP